MYVFHKKEVPRSQRRSHADHYIFPLYLHDYSYPPVLVVESPNSASSMVNRLKSSPKPGVRSSSSSQRGESCDGGEYESNPVNIEDA